MILVKARSCSRQAGLILVTSRWRKLDRRVVLARRDLDATGDLGEAESKPEEVEARRGALSRVRMVDPVVDADLAVLRMAKEQLRVDLGDDELELDKGRDTQHRDVVVATSHVVRVERDGVPARSERGWEQSVDSLERS